MQVFSASWFRRHQRTLVGVLNVPVIGGELRNALDITVNQRLVSIQPNHYICAQEDGSYVADFRTHDKFAKLLHHRFAPIWKTAHAWDRYVANPLVPVLNLGFDSLLTVYPVPGVTQDGLVARSGVFEDWSTIRSGAGNSHDTSSVVNHAVRMTWNNTFASWTALIRSIYQFDTSPLTPAANISAATLSLMSRGSGVGKTDQLSITPDIDIYHATPASATSLVNADYGQIDTTSQTGAAIAYASWTDGVYNDFTFNSTGRGNISKTGVSAYGARNSSYDALNVAPSPAAVTGTSGFGIHYSAESGTDNDPKLVVTYHTKFILIPGR